MVTGALSAQRCPGGRGCRSGCFCEAMEQPGQIDPERIKPWLMKVTRNGCLDRLRRRRENVEFNEGHMAGESSGPMQDVAANELGGWLKRAIEG